MTKAQQRTLVWLPADGGWHKIGMRAAGVESLRRYWPTLIEVRTGSYGLRGGYVRQAKLTLEGQAEVLRLLSAGVTP